MVNFLKGIVAGFGGIAPGLSGTVLLIIMGLYQPTLEALGSLLQDWKTKVKFLLPVVGGMILGVLLFSRLVDFLLARFEMETRFCFLGLILGTVPLLFQEVRAKGLRKWHYGLIGLSILAGCAMFAFQAEGVPQILQPNFLQSVGLGAAVAASSIIPGVDPAALLSSLGLYEAYIGALANLNFGILLPLGLGLLLGAVVISRAMTELFHRCYTVTYCVIFGVFLTMIPQMLNDSCVLGWNGKTLVSLALMVLGFGVSLRLGRKER